MQTIGVIRKFEIGNVQVIVDAVEDYDMDLSWDDDDGEVRAKLESGEYIGFCARARAFYKGHELASDYLGRCVYESLEAFMDHKECGAQNKAYAAKGEAVRCGSYFADMVRSVCRDARKELCELKAARARCTKQ